MSKQRDIMINFPLPILAKSFTKSGRIKLRPMLLEAVCAHIGCYCVKKKIRPDSTMLIIPGISEDILARIIAVAYFKYSWDESFEFQLTWDSIEITIERATDAHKRNTKASPPPYCSISLSVWLDFMENEDYKDDFEKIQLLAAMAVRSIIGPQTAKPIVWEYILSRMAGNPHKEDVETLPDAIQQYDQRTHRKLKEKLIRQLQKAWGIQYEFAGRKPWYCADASVNLHEWITANNQKMVHLYNKSTPI